MRYRTPNSATAGNAVRRGGGDEHCRRRCSEASGASP